MDSTNFFKILPILNSVQRPTKFSLKILLLFSFSTIHYLLILSLSFVSFFSSTCSLLFHLHYCSIFFFFVFVFQSEGVGLFTLSSLCHFSSFFLSPKTPTHKTTLLTITDGRSPPSSILCLLNFCSIFGF